MYITAEEKGIIQRDEDTICLLAHRGRVKLMKQSRLATDGRWMKWIGDFTQVVDIWAMEWQQLENIHTLAI